MQYQHGIPGGPGARAHDDQIRDSRNARPEELERPYDDSVSTLSADRVRSRGFWRRMPGPSIPKIEDLYSPGDPTAGRPLTRSDQARG